MASMYSLVVDISTSDMEIDEETFRSQVDPSLTHLSALKGAFDRKPCTPTYYPPDASKQSSGWSARGVVMISVGKERGEFLLELYESIGDLILMELPQFDIDYKTTIWKFEEDSSS